MSARVGIIMGSDSDLPVMQAAADILTELGVEWELTIVSAHRTPERLYDYAGNAESRGLRSAKASSRRWSARETGRSIGSSRKSDVMRIKGRASTVRHSRVCILHSAQSIQKTGGYAQAGMFQRQGRAAAKSAISRR